jgi:hypothetical protein
MSDPGSASDRFAALLRLREERAAPLPPVQPGEVDAAFVARQMDEISGPAFAAMVAFLTGASEPGSSDQIDRLAMRLLLDDYAAGVARLRAVAQLTSRTLDRVSSTVSDGKKLQARYPVPLEETQSDRHG